MSNGFASWPRPGNTHPRPGVRLMLHQGRPTELAQMVLEGEADIAIATESLHNTVSITPT